MGEWILQRCNKDEEDNSTGGGDRGRSCVREEPTAEGAL